MSKVYSLEAVKVVRRAYELGFRVFSDPNWSLLEAFEKETPSGKVHLHWKNHRGRGQWEILTRYSRTSVCKTARCRVVTIIPHGGEHEACDISRQRYDDAFQTWIDNKALDGIVKRDIERAMFNEHQRKQAIKNAIEAEYGPWPQGERPRRFDYKYGSWMYELDLALAHPVHQPVKEKP